MKNDNNKGVTRVFWAIMMYKQLNYLEESHLSMIPDTKIVIPTPMTMKPLIVQLGLLYINEEDGPTSDLLCNVNVIPRVISMIPMINNDLPMSFFRSIKYIRPNAQKKISVFVRPFDPIVVECKTLKENNWFWKRHLCSGSINPLFLTISTFLISIFHFSTLERSREPKRAVYPVQTLNPKGVKSINHISVSKYRL